MKAEIKGHFATTFTPRALTSSSAPLANFEPIP